MAAQKAGRAPLIGVQEQGRIRHGVIAAIDGWTSGQQCLSESASAVVLQGAQHWVGIAKVTGTGKAAATVTVQVVAHGGDLPAAAAIAAVAMRDDAVGQGQRAGAVVNAATRLTGGVVAVVSRWAFV